MPLADCLGGGLQGFGAVVAEVVEATRPSTPDFANHAVMGFTIDEADGVQGGDPAHGYAEQVGSCDLSGRENDVQFCILVIFEFDDSGVVFVVAGVDSGAD